MTDLEHLLQHLEWAGFGTVSDEAVPGDLFLGEMPPAPDSCLCLMSADMGIGTEGARIEVFVRGERGDYLAPHRRLARVTEHLADFHGFLHGDGPFADITVLSGGEGRGADSLGRHLLVTVVRLRSCGEE